jgi:hypothetical protein
LEEVAALVAELSEAADERLGGADLEWATYDHAAVEAFALAGSAAAMGIDEPAVVSLVLRHGIKLLRSLPIPTGLEWVDGRGWVGVFRLRLWAELEALGLPPPELEIVRVALAA